MLSSFLSLFDRDHLPKTAKFIYRDGLNLNKNKNKNSKQKLKDADFCFVSSKPESGSAIRVKVTMTKKEAARLLSKCKEGRVLGFKDVADELVQIPVSRISVESNPRPSSHAVLKSIPE